jgi:hypothetical protein
MLDLSKTKSSDNGIRRTDQEEVTIIFLDDCVLPEAARYHACASRRASIRTAHLSFSKLSCAIGESFVWVAGSC